MFQSTRLITGIVGTALLIAAMVAGVYAQGPMGRRGSRGFGMGPGGFPGLAQLDLSEAQRSEIRGVREEYRGKMREAATQLREAHQAQRRAIEIYPIDVAAVEKTAQALAKAHTDMALVQAHLHDKISSILTHEQRMKAQELAKQREARMKEREKWMQERSQRRPRA